jgi:prepilin peptidase CpaA
MMWSVESIPGIVAVAVSLAACVTDVRSARIPNALTFTAAGAAIVFHLLVGGWRAGGASVAGWFVDVLLFAPFFLVGGLGAGDLKLLGAIGAWLGPWPAVYVALYTALAGGVMAIALALAHGYARTAFRNLGYILASWRVGIRTVPGMTLDDAPGPKLAYALPVAVGTSLTLWFR